MTLIVKFGRRVPKSWFKRQVFKVQGLLTFQENLWQMITQSFRVARKRAIAESKPPLTFALSVQRENESLNYVLEWFEIVVQGLPEQEKEEHAESLKIYDSVGRYFKNNGKNLDFTGNENLKDLFKTKVLNEEQLKKAVEVGKSSMDGNNVANKLLEMGILTHIEFKDDYEQRMNTALPQSSSI